MLGVELMKLDLETGKNKPCHDVKFDQLQTVHNFVCLFLTARTMLGVE